MAVLTHSLTHCTAMVSFAILPLFGPDFS